MAELTTQPLNHAKTGSLGEPNGSAASQQGGLLARTDAAHWKTICSSKLSNQQSAELQNEVDSARGFLIQFAQGPARQRALAGLEAFEHNRVKCRPQERSFTIHSLARPLLIEFNALLNNPNIPTNDRVRSAENLFSSLGVCDEGETSHLQDHTAELQAKLKGFEGKFNHTRVQMARQHLLALLRHHQPDSEASQLTEIHTVNGLLNSVADLVGCDLKEDGYISQRRIHRYAPQARALIEQCLPTAAVINHLTQEVSELARNALRLSQPSDGTESPSQAPFDGESVAQFDQLLKSEFAGELSLHDVIALDDQGTHVQLKPPQAIRQVLFEAAQRRGALSASAEFEAVMNQPVVQAHHFIATLDAPVAPRRHTINSLTFGLGQGLFKRLSRQIEEEGKKRRVQPSRAESLNSLNQARAPGPSQKSDSGHNG